MTLYFIDTENLNGIWADYIIEKYKQDNNSKFLIFVTEKTSSLSWRYLEAFRTIKASALEFCETHNGEKNALDFCLVERLGEEISRSKSRHFVIVSKDKGFDAAINYVNQRHNLKVVRETTFDAPEPVSSKVLNHQRREKLANLCGVSASMAEQLRARLFAEKKDFSPYKDSLEYTVHWIENSHAQSFKQEPELKQRLTDTLLKHYQEIMAM